MVLQDNDQSYHIACLLSNVASQNHEMIKLLLVRQDRNFLLSLFDSSLRRT
jgi:hypothetical protein